MIIDLKKFITTEQPFWEELDNILIQNERDPYRRMTFEDIKRLHYLYQRASSDLSKISTFSAEPAIRDDLESLVGRAYAMIHTAQQEPIRFSFWRWFWGTFPQTFRRNRRAFGLSLATLLFGAIFGAGAIVLDPEAKAILMPFEHLEMDPADRVALEEQQQKEDHLRGNKSRFSAFLITHNTRISIFVLALGMTWGIGTIVVLYGNGVMLGAVVADYIQANQGMFLAGWLLPHGVIEIPSILLAGQAGLLLAGAMIGRKSALVFSERLRQVVPEVVTLICAVTIMLGWAGIVEAFFSQYHAPVIAYEVKIAFGLIEFTLLAIFFWRSGRREIRSMSWQRVKGWYNTWAVNFRGNRFRKNL